MSMRETYDIIRDEKLLNEFIEWLPELTREEKFYCCLFARSKYCKQLVHIKSDKAQLKRFVSDKERLVQKIRQLECPIGGYMQRDVIIPNEALALYITVNPRQMYKAGINTMVKLATAVRDQNSLMNPHQEALSEIQRTKSRTVYVDFDLDVADSFDLEDALKNVQNCVNPEALTCIKTRGGVHCLVEPSKVDKDKQSHFYQNIIAIKGVDQAGDCMIPVIGCTQGGHTPYFIKINENGNTRKEETRLAGDVQK